MNRKETTSAPRRAAAVSLIAAPLLGLPTSQIWPDNPIDPADRLGVIAENSGRYVAANLMTVLMIVLFVPAILGLVHLLRGRKPRLSHVGGALAGLGIVGWSGVTALTSIEVEMAKAADRAAMVDLAERFQSSVGPAVFLVMFLLGLFVGLIVLAIGLWRAGLVRAWVPIAVVAAVVIDVVASTEQLAVAVVWGLLTAALGSVGLRVLRMSNADWERAAMPIRTGDGPPESEAPAHQRQPYAAA